MKRFLCITTAAIAFAVSFVPPAFSEGEAKDPIDVAMDAAMEKDPSTAGMVAAIVEAEKKWNKVIGFSLAKLRKRMAPEEWKALEASQAAWNVYRDKENATKGEIFSRMEGTMWVPVSASSSLDLTKERALMLRRYLELMDERG